MGSDGFGLVALGRGGPRWSGGLVHGVHPSLDNGVGHMGGGAVGDGTVG